jgi:NAD(P)-dependent dehydrogenase (short-subunit alcohol dehydrogenase family)
VKAKLGKGVLYAVVNNAGVASFGSSKAEKDSIIKTNVYGPKLMTDSYLPLLCPKAGRIVNVGSGLGPGYVKNLTEEEQKFFRSRDVTWEQLSEYCTEKATEENAYGLSKAILASFTLATAKAHPNLMVSCLSPGFVATDMAKEYGAKTTPEEGTFSTRHCLFAELKGSGIFYGSDALRSPLHMSRDPGTPEYTGEE